MKLILAIILACSLSSEQKLNISYYIFNKTTSELDLEIVDLDGVNFELIEWNVICNNKLKVIFKDDPNIQCFLCQMKNEVSAKILSPLKKNDGKVIKRLKKHQFIWFKNVSTLGGIAISIRN